jgi:hypothetical protein
MKETLVTISLFLAACSRPQVVAIESDTMICGSVCTSRGVAATAGHCVGSREPVVLLQDRACEEPITRRAHAFEVVSIEGFGRGVKSHRSSLVIDGNWAGWLITTGRATPGESGGAVLGRDGALLGIAVETRDGLTYARLVR